MKHCTFLVCLIISILTGIQAVSFNQIDITKTPGLGKEAAAAAAKVCDPTKFNATELKIRHDVGQRAEGKFFDKITPKLQGAELKAVLCQKRRNKVMKSTCQMQANILFNFKDNGVAEQTNKRKNNIRLTDVDCGGVDSSLFVDVKF